MALTESERKQERKEKPLTKVIIRRLPPSMDQETFLNQVAPVPDFNYIYTVRGDSSLGENAFSRVYLNFVNPDDVYGFKERFDNYVFVDNKGHEYPAVVEFAPFQKIPKKRGKTRMDPKCATIESDPIYLEFVELLNKPKEQDKKPEYSLQLTTETNKNDVTTPLLEYIKNKRAQRLKIREVRREERKRREFDRRRERYDERKKTMDEKSPVKKTQKDVAEANSEYKDDKPEKHYEKSYYKSKDRKYDDRRKEIKPRYPRKDYIEKDYKERDNRPKFDETKKEESKSFPKKVKKYSEKREERKIEAQKKLEQSVVSKETATPQQPAEPLKEPPETPKHEPKSPKTEQESKSETQRRIRNKDRPTIAIYRPGMLSKRKQNEELGEKNTENKNDPKH